MPNKMRGESEIEIEGKVYRLRSSMRVPREFRDRFDKKIQAYFNELQDHPDDVDPDGELLWILHAMLRAGGNEITEDDLLDKLIFPDDIQPMIEAIGKCWNASAAGGDAAPLPQPKTEAGQT